MRINREEKRSLKKLFVGILVMALLVTMMPFENIGKIVAKAEGATVTEEEKNTSSLQSTAPFNADTPVIWVESYVSEDNSGTISASQAFVEQLSAIIGEIRQNETNPYPNGVIIKLGENIDLENSSMPELFVGNIGIDLNGYSITNVNWGNAASISDVAYESTLIIASEKEGSVFSFPKNDTSQNTQWCIYNGQKLVFDGVDVQNVDIMVEPGAGFGLDDYYYDIPVAQTEDAQVTEKIYYYADKGLYREKIDQASDEYNLYVEDLYFKEEQTNAFDVNISLAMENQMENRHYEYSQSAVDALNSQGLKMLYDNGYFQKEYEMPSVPFTVDQTFGVYSLSEDQNSIILYALRAGALTSTFKKVDDETQNIRLMIYNPYEIYTMEGDKTVVENVIYTKGAIPKNYSIDGSNETVNCEITEILISGTSGDIPSGIHFQIDASEFTGLKVFNGTKSKVSFIDGIEGNEIWVGYSNSIVGGNQEQIESIEIETEAEPNEDQMRFAKQGDVCLVTLNEGYTLSNIQYGAFSYDPDNDIYSYEDGCRADTSHMIFYPDGKVGFIIPNYSVDLSFDVEQIVPLDDMNKVVFNPSSIFEDEINGHYHSSVFEITGVEGQYKIQDLQTGEFSSVIKEAVEGNHTRRYYIIDMSTEMDTGDLDGDGVTNDTLPSSTYGRVMYLDYAFVLDTTAPILLYTDANNSNQTELKSNEVYEGDLYFTISETGSGLANFIVYEKNGEDWISNSENLVSTADDIYIKQVETDMTYRIEIADVVGNETIYDNILVKAAAQEVVPVPPEAEPEPPEVVPVPPEAEPEPPTEEPESPTDTPASSVAVGSGRANLVSGTAYTLGEGTWKVNGDSTNYAGGITFYVSENGEYEFSQQ